MTRRNDDKLFRINMVIDVYENQELSRKAKKNVRTQAAFARIKLRPIGGLKGRRKGSTRRLRQCERHCASRIA